MLPRTIYFLTEAQTSEPRSRSQEPDDPPSVDHPALGKLDYKPLAPEQVRQHIATLADSQLGSKDHWDSALALTQHYYRHIYNASRDFQNIVQARAARAGAGEKPFVPQDFQDALGTVNLGYITRKGTLGSNPLKNAAEQFVDKGTLAKSRNADVHFGGFVKNAVRTVLNDVHRGVAQRRTSEYEEAKRGARSLRQKKGQPRDPSQPERWVLSRAEWVKRQQDRAPSDPSVEAARQEELPSKNKMIRQAVETAINKRFARSPAAQDFLRHYVQLRLSGLWSDKESQAPKRDLWHKSKLAAYHGVNPVNATVWITKFHDYMMSGAHPQARFLRDALREWLDRGFSLEESISLVLRPALFCYDPRTLTALSLCEQSWSAKH